MRLRVTIGVMLAFLAIVGMFWLQPVSDDAPVSAQQTVFPTRRSAGYTSSAACVECHREQHASWHGSYHRAMTQQATPQTVVASFDDVHLETAGQTAHLYRRGDDFWVNMVDPAWEQATFARWAETRNTGAPDPFEETKSPPRIDAKIVMTTGSHHFQAYWIRGRQGRELLQFPWRYHIGEQRWVHRKDVFLTPPEWRPGMWFRMWNSQCIYCHSTGPYPGLDPRDGTMARTEIAEMGIACEACHGPGEQHIAFRQNPPPTQKPATDPVVNPAKLPNKASAQVCGSCHSHFQHEDPQLAVHGPGFRPGANLFHFGSLALAENETGVLSRFWQDGTNRSAGREYNGLSASECHLQGELACVTCHSMHNSDPNDQLKPEAVRGDVCLKCHDDLSDPESLSAHTHHNPDSSGSLCYNCHMPHTNYGLFKAIRSHTIVKPRIAPLLSNTRPNACNLCHLDQTLQWSADHLEAWYGTEPPMLGADDSTVAAGILWALKGDAGQRVIAAWHFGWAPARAASGNQWMVPWVVELMKDPYAAVRWVAFQSLRKDSRFAATQFDFDQSEETRRTTIEQLTAAWHSMTREPLDPVSRNRLLQQNDGSIDQQRAEQLLEQRDQRMIAGVE